MLKLNINGQIIEVPEQYTILEAAQSVGIDIPTFCHDPELSKPGACRICVVEIQGFRNLAPACVTMVSEGMVIETESGAVIDARKANLALLLANHPFDCMTCEKTGDCKLQDYTYRYNVKSTPYQGDKHDYDLDSSNPFLERDMNKCILCGNCVRVCDEVVGRSIYGFINRGFTTKVAPALDVDLGQSECVFCGSCAAVCPTGAITAKMMHRKGRPWEIKKVKTTCGYCGVGCNLDLNVKDGKVIGATSNSSSIVNGRWLCVKGRFGYNFIHHPDRLNKPLVRKNGVLEEVEWEEALTYTAEKFLALKKQYGADTFGILSSARITNEENYLVNKFARAVIGTNNIDHCARL